MTEARSWSAMSCLLQTQRPADREAWAEAAAPLAMAAVEVMEATAAVAPALLSSTRSTEALSRSIALSPAIALLARLVELVARVAEVWDCRGAMGAVAGPWAPRFTMTAGQYRSADAPLLRIPPQAPAARTAPMELAT